MPNDSSKLTKTSGEPTDDSPGVKDIVGCGLLKKIK